MSFRDINNSTVKLEDGDAQKAGSAQPTPYLEMEYNGKMVAKTPTVIENFGHGNLTRGSDATEITQDQILVSNQIYIKRGKSAIQTKKLSLREDNDITDVLP